MAAMSECGCDGKAMGRNNGGGRGRLAFAGAGSGSAAEVAGGGSAGTVIVEGMLHRH
jgi:hypothetical protein